MLCPSLSSRFFSTEVAHTVTGRGVPLAITTVPGPESTFAEFKATQTAWLQLLEHLNVKVRRRQHSISAFASDPVLLTFTLMLVPVHWHGVA